MSQLQEVSSVEKRGRKVNPYIKYIFGKPKLEEIEDNTIPIRKIILGAADIVKQTKTITIQKEVSIAGRYLDEIGRPARTPSFPRWKDWYSTPNAVKIGTIIDLILKHVLYDTTLQPTSFTEEKFLDQQFRASQRLIQAVNSKDELKSIIFENEDGGIDIFSSITSFSDPSKRYYQIISIGRGEGDSPYRVRVACTCATSGTVCKHLIAAIGAHIPEIYGTIYAFLHGRQEKEKWINEFRRRQERVARELEKLARQGYDFVWEAYIYYMVKLLMRGNLKPYRLSGYMAEHLASEIKSIIETGKLPANFRLVKEAAETVEEVATKSKTYRIVWTKEMEQARKQVLSLIKELSSRFGIVGGRSSWAEMLAFALVMSADYNKTPIVLHALGDIGTFKTTGAKLIAQYIKVPELVITGKGEPRAVYESIISIVSTHLGIPASSIMNRIGGLVSHVARKGNTVEVGLNLGYVYSYLSIKPDGAKKYQELLNDLKKAGYTISTRHSGATVDIKDHMQISRIENYRYTYVPDEKLGLLVKSDVFDNYVLVVDEGSRNPEALEGMLTKMSISTINEGVRVIIVTDNIEPHVEMVRNPRYAPLYDRMFIVFTSGITDETAVMKYLFTEPSIKFDTVTLLGIRKFIEEIPVHDEIIYTVKAASNALSYKYTIIATEDGEKFLKPIRRYEKAPIEIDVIPGDYDFMPGGRFTVHTLLLSKFHAFLNKHDRVMPEDVKKALYTTVASRLVVDAPTYADYKLKVVEVAEQLIEKYTAMRNAFTDVLKFITLLNENKYDKANELFQKLVSKISEAPEYAPVLMAGLELYTALHQVDLDRLPRPIAYTIAEILLVKGDTSTLAGTRTFKEILEIHRRGLQ